MDPTSMSNSNVLHNRSKLTSTSASPPLSCPPFGRSSPNGCPPPPAVEATTPPVVSRLVRTSAEEEGRGAAASSRARQRDIVPKRWRWLPPQWMRRNGSAAASVALSETEIVDLVYETRRRHARGLGNGQVVFTRYNFTHCSHSQH